MIQRLLNGLYDQHISIGEINEVLHRVSDWAKPTVCDILRAIRGSPDANADNSVWAQLQESKCSPAMFKAYAGTQVVAGVAIASAVVLDVAGGSVVAYVDEKFAAQLSRQLAKDGAKSVFKTARPLEKNIAEHVEKLSKCKYTSSIQKELRVFKNQLKTVRQFIERKGL